MNFYLFFRKFHLVFSLIALLPILAVSITGLILLFEAEVSAWLDQRDHVEDSALVLSLEDDRSVLYQQIDQLLVENRPCRLSYVRHNLQSLSLPWIYLTCPSGSRTFEIDLIKQNSYPLENETKRQVFRFITDLHRTLLFNRLVIDGVNDDKHLGTLGRNLVGICSLVLLFNLVSGFILWFIRGKKLKFSIRQFKFTPANRKINIRQLHAVTGLYIAPILMLIIITGISWTWRADVYSALQYLHNKEEVSPKFYSTQPSPGSRFASLPEIYHKLTTAYPELQVQGIAPPLRRNAIVSIRLVERDSMSFTPQHHLSLDAYTLEEKYRVDSWTAERADSLHAYSIVQYGLHTGFVFGELGKWLWASVNMILIVSMLGFGFYLWIQRKWPQRRQSSNVRKTK